MEACLFLPFLGGGPGLHDTGVVGEHLEPHQLLDIGAGEHRLVEVDAELTHTHRGNRNHR